MKPKQNHFDHKNQKIVESFKTDLNERLDHSILSFVPKKNTVQAEVSIIQKMILSAFKLGIPHWQMKRGRIWDMSKKRKIMIFI